MGILWEFFGTFGSFVLYMLGITVGIFYMMSYGTNYGYKKIFRLKGRQTGQKKRSLEARADAFSRLKILKSHIVQW